MSVFEGDWREVSQFVSHVENLRKWVQTFGVIEEIECDEEGNFPSDSTLEIELLAEQLWTMKGSDHAGVILLLGVHESWETLGFFRTKVPFDKQTVFNNVEIPLDCRIACPKCSPNDEPYGLGCEYCDEEGSLTLLSEDIDRIGSEYNFPTGGYFTNQLKATA